MVDGVKTANTAPVAATNLQFHPDQNLTPQADHATERGVIHDAYARMKYGVTNLSKAQQLDIDEIVQSNKTINEMLDREVEASQILDRLEPADRSDYDTGREFVEMALIRAQLKYIDLEAEEFWAPSGIVSAKSSSATANTTLPSTKDIDKFNKLIGDEKNPITTENFLTRQTYDDEILALAKRRNTDHVEVRGALPIKGVLIKGLLEEIAKDQANNKTNIVPFNDNGHFVYLIARGKEVHILDSLAPSTGNSVGDGLNDAISRVEGERANKNKENLFSQINVRNTRLQNHSAKKTEQYFVNSCGPIAIWLQEHFNTDGVKDKPLSKGLDDFVNIFEKMSIAEKNDKNQETRCQMFHACLQKLSAKNLKS